MLWRWRSLLQTVTYFRQYYRQISNQLRQLNHCSGGADFIVYKYDMSLAAIDAGNPRYYCDQYRQHSV